MKRAIFGGTFNPVHYGHIRIAEDLRKTLALDEVIFIPAYTPPHKVGDRIAPPRLRLEMVRLALADYPSLTVSQVEIERGERDMRPSYTLDTVREVGAGKGEEAPYVIMGADSFNEITTWHEYESLLKEANLLILPRPSVVTGSPEEVLPVELAVKFCYDAVENLYRSEGGTSIRFLETPLVDISSTEIRRLVCEGESIEGLTPSKVVDFIDNNRLYR